MRFWGFSQGEASPYLFVHDTRGIAVSVQGDDFTSTEHEIELDWLEAKNFGRNTNYARAADVGLAKTMPNNRAS